MGSTHEGVLFCFKRFLAYILNGGGEGLDWKCANLSLKFIFRTPLVKCLVIIEDQLHDFSTEGNFVLFLNIYLFTLSSAERKIGCCQFYNYQNSGCQNELFAGIYTLKIK